MPTILGASAYCRTGPCCSGCECFQWTNSIKRWIRTKVKKLFSADFCACVFLIFCFCCFVGYLLLSLLCLLCERCKLFAKTKRKEKKQKYCNIEITVKQWNVYIDIKKLFLTTQRWYMFNDDIWSNPMQQLCTILLLQFGFC